MTTIREACFVVYSPHSSSGFYLFNSLKVQLRGTKFIEDSEVMVAVEESEGQENKNL